MDDLAPDCSAGESFALMVLGHSMALHRDEWTFRQLLRAGTGWTLHPLNPAFADAPLQDLSAVRGVIIQKALPGRRRASKHYI